MFNSDTELFFPMRVIPLLSNLRGAEWKALIDNATSTDEGNLDAIAISLMMTRLGGCVNCNVDSFRAMRGCTECARLTLRRFKSSDTELLRLFENSRHEVRDFLEKNEKSTSTK